MKALLSILHDSHDREPSEVLSSVAERQDSGGCLKGFGSPGPARRRFHRDPRRAAEALTPAAMELGAGPCHTDAASEVDCER